MSRIRTRPADRRGAASVELAVIAPTVLLLMLGGYDLTMWIRVGYRLEAVTSQLGQVISQCAQVDDPGDISAFEAAAQQIATGTDISSQGGGAFIITAIGNVQGSPGVLWQKRVGNAAFTSHFSQQPVDLGGYAIQQGQVMIGTEAFSNIQPRVLSRGLFGSVPAAQALSSISTFLVRSTDPNQLGALTQSAAKACAS